MNYLEVNESTNPHQEAAVSQDERATYKPRAEHCTTEPLSHLQYHEK